MSFRHAGKFDEPPVCSLRVCDLCGADMGDKRESYVAEPDVRYELHVRTRLGGDHDGSLDLCSLACVRQWSASQAARHPGLK